MLEERSRLARDLHDAVSQKLFSLRARARAAAVLAGRDPRARPGRAEMEASRRSAPRRTPSCAR